MRVFAEQSNFFIVMMKIVRLLYLMCFLGPVAFLLGFIVGAPRSRPQIELPVAVDGRHLPAQVIDFTVHEGNLALPEREWLRSNEALESPGKARRQ